MASLIAQVKSKLFIHSSRKSLHALDGAYASLLHGRSLDFEDLRKYEYGDQVRDIDWRATARLGTPLVKRHRAMRMHTILFVVDTGRSMAALAARREVEEGSRDPRDGRARACWRCATATTSRSCTATPTACAAAHPAAARALSSTRCARSTGRSTTSTRVERPRRAAVVRHPHDLATHDRRGDHRRGPRHRRDRADATAPARAARRAVAHA